MNKRGEEDLITEYIVFILFSLLFFVAAFYFAGKLGDSKMVYEQIYAKKIALAIDAAKPGMEINFNISNLYKFNKNAEFRPIIVIESNATTQVNSVRVSFTEKGGYTYSYFSDYDVKGDFSSVDKMVYEIKIGEKIV